MFVFRNSIWFGQHHRLMVELDNIDFGNGGGNGSGTNANNNQGNGGSTDNNNNGGNGSGDNKTGDGKDGEGNNKDNPEPNNANDNPDNKDNNKDNPSNSSTGGLEVGTNVEFEGKKYTVAENGDLVDADGKVFKEAKDVDEWIKSLEVDEPGAEVNIENIRKAMNIDITDENGNPVEFTDDIEGVKSYINSAIELKSNEVAAAAVNKVFVDNPILKQFVDYLTVNGGDPRGFGERPVQVLLLMRSLKSNKLLLLKLLLENLVMLLLMIIILSILKILVVFMMKLKLNLLTFKTLISNVMRMKLNKLKLIVSNKKLKLLLIGKVLKILLINVKLEDINFLNLLLKKLMDRKLLLLQMIFMIIFLVELKMKMVILLLLMSVLLLINLQRKLLIKNYLVLG